MIEVFEGTLTASSAGRKQEINEGEGTLMTETEGPERPTPLPRSPEPIRLLETYYELPIRIGLETSSPLAAVHYMLSREPRGRAFLREGFLEPGARIRLEALEDGEYFLFLSGLDERGLESRLSGPHAFTLKTTPPPPDILSPGGLQQYVERIAGNTVDIDWKEVNTAKAYRVIVARDRAFGVVVKDIEVRETELRVEYLDYGNYFLKISSLDEKGQRGPWSETIEFLIVPTSRAPLPEGMKPEDMLKPGN